MTFMTSFSYNDNTGEQFSPLVRIQFSRSLTEWQAKEALTWAIHSIEQHGMPKAEIGQQKWRAEYIEVAKQILTHGMFGDRALEPDEFYRLLRTDGKAAPSR